MNKRSVLYKFASEVYCTFCCACFECICEAMLDSMNLPDKTFAERFVLVLFQVIIQTLSEPGKFCCRLQIHKFVKAWRKLPARLCHSNFVQR